ncbi:hypothetical protein LTR78_010801, partial [Recurvomyces mirabilis]
MSIAKLAIDPLWQCLCPAWTQVNTGRSLRRILQCQTDRRPARGQQRAYSAQAAARSPTISHDGPSEDTVLYGRDAAARAKPVPRRQHAYDIHRKALAERESLTRQPTPYLYTRLRTLAANGKTKETWDLVEMLLRDRKEKPSLQLYNALILSNTSHDDGAAWRVIEYLEEMAQAGLQMDSATCHAILKVLAVHPDHLLRADVLEYMRARWYQLADDGAHDVAAGLLREGSFEAALRKIDEMQGSGVVVQSWLLDMSVYMLSAAGEIVEAYRIMRQRYDAGELNLSRVLWYTLLDASSSHRHHACTAHIWNSQVRTGYMRPASGICLNVLTTASQAGDAVLATDVFSHLSKRGTAFTPIHYQLLTTCYLTTTPPDLKRALTTLTIMALEKKLPPPSQAETRTLFLYLRDKPVFTAFALNTLLDLHKENRKIPIAALNLIIESYVHQRNLQEALNVYKQIHTFIPGPSAPASATQQRPFANIETFNLLLRGCRVADPPDENLASFLVSELLALRVKPTALTYDRLILVFVQAGMHALDSSGANIDSEAAASQRKRGLELLDWAFRHFTDMQAVSSTSPAPATLASATSPSDLSHDHSDDGGGPARLGWMPRFGTVE